MTAYSEMNYYERVMNRHAQLKDDRNIWDASRQEIVEYFRPDITTHSTESTQQGQFVHDSIAEGTGAWSALVMARGFQGSLVGPSLKWRRSQMQQQELRGNDEINAWLQRTNDYLLDQVYQQSNFYELIGTDVLDGITIGSPVMLIEENLSSGVIECKLPHYRENYLKRDWFGHDILYHREFELSSTTAQMRFGKENLPERVQRQLEQGEHLKKDKYLMVVYSAGDPIFAGLKASQPEGFTNGLHFNPVVNRPWVLHYFAMDVEDKKFQGHLPDRNFGYFHKPFAAWHYWRNSFETYARTPAWYAIYDEKGGQAAWTTMYDAAESAARPAMIGLKAMKGRTFVGPGKFTWAQQDNEYDRPPKPMNTGINYPHAIDFVDRVDDKRKRHFNIDLFRMLDEFSRQHKQPPTAFQVAQMIAEKNVQIGPAIQSFDRGLLTPVDNTFVEIEVRSGRFERQTDPPDIVFETNGNIQPQFTGPLAQAQRLSVAMRRVNDSLSLASPIFDRWPDSIHKIDEGILLERILEELDFYQEAIVDQESYNEIKESLNMSRQRQAMLENALTGSEIAKNLGSGQEQPQLTGAA
jgi:hypothetical protein